VQSQNEQEGEHDKEHRRSHSTMPAIISGLVPRSLVVFRVFRLVPGNLVVFRVLRLIRVTMR